LSCIDLREKMLRMAEMGSISRWIGTALTALIALAVGILGLPSRAPRRLAHPPPVATAAAPTRDDVDADGVLDARENEVARRFAPIVVHQSAEAVYPTSVDEFLAGPRSGSMTTPAHPISSCRSGS